MTKSIIYLLQSIKVKEQKRELTRCALGTLDLSVNGFHQMAVVGQSGQRILGCLLTQMILELALLGDVLDDDLVTVDLALVADLTSAEPHFQGRAIFMVPFNFQRIVAIVFDRAAQ